MSFHEPVAAPARSAPRVRTGGLLVQRTCACGNHARGGECEACRRKKAVQRKDRGTADPVARSPGSASQGGTGGLAGNFSGIAVRGAGSAPALRTQPRVQRQAAGTPPVAEPAPAPEAAPEPAATGPAASLIVDDDAAELQPGQMRKTEFLDQLQRTVCAEADAALAASGRDTRGCPYLAGWFRFYRGQGAAHVEAALRRYAPEARAARSAADYAPLVATRVRQGVTRWAETGEITGVPEGVPLTPAGSLAALGGAVGAIGSALGGLMFKERDGGAHRDDDPAAVQRSLGTGRPLESGVRGRMERAFGHSFAGVRTHTGSTAHRVSAEQNARAFTVGRDVAFGAGEYRPGTPVGDALIAHELAHVVQQGGASPETQAKPAASVSYGALERDADDAAVGAVASLWGGVKGALAGVAQRTMPTLKSGLRLQRCASTRARPTGPSATTQPAPDGPGQPLPAAEPVAQDETAARADAIASLVSDANCQPTPIALEKMAAIPGASLTNFGWTQPTTATRSISPRFDSRSRECFLLDYLAASLSFDQLVYVGPGEYRYDTQTRRDAGCGKELPLFVEVTSEAAELFKAAEVEHCRDLSRAFDLTWGRFNTAAAAVKAKGRFPATNLPDCEAKIKKEIGDRMGFDYDQLIPIYRCLGEKSKERDTRNWHDVDVELTKEKKTDPECTKIVHVLDETRIVPDVGTHPTEDLVKGCNEPSGP